jgi:predicted Zn-dependent protease
MKATRFRLDSLLILSILLLSCSTVPITGRKQISLIPSSTMLSLSFQQYDQFLQGNAVITGTADARMVQRTGRRIQAAVERFFAENNLSSELDGFAWEYNLVDSEQVNAWCMPGGKVVVYTGILQHTRDETGLAVVMGHEIAHAVAQHGNERMSQGLVLQMGGMALAKALEKEPQKTQALALTAFGVGSQVFGILPYSRLQEYEADRLGLIFMAMAGYDPGAAVDFWTRMSQGQGGQAPPEFLSTHPSEENRIRKLRELQAEAETYRH